MLCNNLTFKTEQICFNEVISCLYFYFSFWPISQKWRCNTWLSLKRKFSKKNIFIPKIYCIYIINQQKQQKSKINVRNFVDECKANFYWRKSETRLQCKICAEALRGNVPHCCKNMIAWLPRYLGVLVHNSAF